MYLASNGKRRAITSMETMDKFDFDPNMIVTVQDVIIGSIPSALS